MVLKYQSWKPMKDGSIPEPIFFEPNNERVGATTFEGSRPVGGYWKCEPFTDSWSIKHNPNRTLKKPQMPAGPRFNMYSTNLVTMATPEEAKAYYNLRNGIVVVRDPDGKVEGVEYDISKRWEQGMDHHPESIKLYKRISDLDYKFGGDAFCFKQGGDGDNGEHLMYLLDIHFEEQDKLT